MKCKTRITKLEKGQTPNIEQLKLDYLVAQADAGGPWAE